MTRQHDSVPVLFRADRTGEFKGSVTAVFPTLAADYRGHEMMCYAHIGQHSSCSVKWYNNHTRAATPAEYADLLAELKSIGYNVRICKRITPQMRDERIDSIKAMP